MAHEALDEATNAALDEREHKAKSKISEMSRQGVTLRKLVEITIRKGAQYSSDWGPGGNDPEGYCAYINEKLTNEPGDKVAGYVIRIDEDSLRISTGLLQQKNARGPDNICVNGCAVHSYRVIPSSE